MRIHPDTPLYQRGELNRRTSIGVSLLVVLAGSAALWLIFNTEPVPERETAVRQSAMLVEVTTPETGDFRPVIQAMGSVIPAREIVLRPRVSGEVIEISNAFVPGGAVKKGEILVRLDDTDYLNVLRQRESELMQAVAELELEKGRGQKAEQDYIQLGRQVPEERKSLILREPQLRSAQALVQSAQAAVTQAKLDLERTRIRAPFDAQVLSRDVNLGSQLASGEAMAQLVGVENYWVEATIPLDKLRWLYFAEDANKKGSNVSIRHRTAWEQGQTRTGSLFQLIGELEGETRLARVLIDVPDPLARAPQSAGQQPLMIGTFVECQIEGKEIRSAVRLRREHVRANDTVWVMRDGKLAIEPVDIVFEDESYAYLESGLASDDQIVTTSLATVREGNPLRINGSPAP